MIASVCSYKNADSIFDALDKCDIPIAMKKSISDYDFCLFAKQNLDQLSKVKILILDYAACSNSVLDMINTLSTLRMTYNDLRIIFISNMLPGEEFLYQIFCLGIYDIVNDNEETLVDELLECIKEPKTYGESIKYKYEKEKINNQTFQEKVIYNTEIQAKVNKALIGFTNAGRRMGCTHNLIVSASYLRDKGYKIAAVELTSNNFKTFSKIGEYYGKEENEGFFKLNQIDYYPDYDIENIHELQRKNYNFILIDFGIYNEVDKSNYNKCIITFIHTSYKPWEIDELNKVYELASEEELKEYTYLFNYTDASYLKEIKDNMVICEKIYISIFNPDPFEASYGTLYDKLFKGYVSETKIIERNRPLLLKAKEEVKKVCTSLTTLLVKKESK